MAAFAQSLGQTLGRTGNDYGSAVDANLNTALAVIQNKLTMQEIQQQMRAQDQRMAEEAIRMKQMQVPVSLGTYQTGQGIFDVQRDPNTGKVTGSIVPGSQQLTAIPPELSDENITSATNNLPPQERDLAVTQLKLARFVGQQSGDYSKAITALGMLTGRAAPKTTGAAASLEEAKAFATEMGYIPNTVPWLQAVKELWKPGLAGGTSATTDPASGLTTYGSHTRGPQPQNVPRGTPNNNVPPQVAQTTPSRTVPSVTPPGAPPTPPVDKANLPWRGVGTYTDEDIKNLAQQWQDTGEKPEGKIEPIVRKQMAAHGMVPGEKGAGTLTPVAQKVLIQTDPVIQQIDKLRGDIERLNLTQNNQRGYLFVPYINYKTGARAPVNSLGDDIAGFSLGSIVEATSALSAQGGGSRALPALRWALEHTPNVWKDSPTLIYKKLADIKERLAIVEDDAKTFGMKGYRVNQPGTPGSQPSQGIIVVTPEDMK